MKNKIGLVVIFSLVVLSLLFSLIYLPYTNSKSEYVVIGDNTIWKNNGSKWSSISMRNLKRMSFEEFYSFDGDEYIGKTYLNYDNELEIYNSNFENISLTNELLSIKSSNDLKNMKVASSFDDIDDGDAPYIKEVLDKYSIIEEGSETAIKYIADLNNDGTDDYIYSISNFYNNEEKNQAYSIVFSVINENIEVIDSTIVDEAEELKEKALYLKHVVDIDSDNKYEFIIFETSFGNIKEDCYTMYKYDSSSNKYVRLIGC